MSPYIRIGELAVNTNYQISKDKSELAIQTAELALHESGPEIPNTIVVDVGQMDNNEWAVVEANGDWGFGIYGCNPDDILDVIRHSCVRIKPDIS